MEPKTLTDWALNQGPVVFILSVIVVWGYRMATARMEKLHEENKFARANADAERDKRFEDMRSRFASSDARHEICEKERASIQAQMIEFLLKSTASTVIDEHK